MSQWCPSCGAEVAAGVPFCERCGAAVAAPEGSPRGKAATGAWRAIEERLRDSTEGEFEWIGTLGVGAMGAVFLARELSLERLVAIKVMSPALLLDEEMVHRFIREARTVASLKHPNILAIHAVRQLDELHYYVMDYVDGATLSDVLRRHRPLPVEVVRDVVFQVGSALDHAHRDRGIVHRDVKPGNIMIDRRGAAILTDFGIAKSTRTKDVTQTGMVIGTPEYMSPEQIQGREASGASDQYSLGVVAYEMLCGKAPFAEKGAWDTMAAHVAEAPTPIRELRADCPPELAHAVMRMLEKSADARWPAIGEALRYAGGQPLGDDHPVRATLAAWAIEGLGAPVAQPAAPAAPPAPVEPDEADLHVPAPRAGPARTDEPDGGTIAWTPSPADAAAGPPASPSPPPLTRWFEDAPSHPPAPPPPEPGEFTRLFAMPGAPPVGAELPVKLTVTRSSDPGAVGVSVSCRRFPFTVGRSPDSDLHLRGDRAISRQHAEIGRVEGGYVIRDLSRNGVFVNGRAIRGESEPLTFGATIVLSGTTSLSFGAEIPRIPDLTGRVLKDRFRLDRILHESTKATTYAAEDLRLSRTLALKVFSPSLIGIGLYREEFQQQVELAARLQHPHICHAFDSDETAVTIDGIELSISFMWMPLMTGGDLADVLDRDEPPDLETIGSWIRALASAIDYAHRNGVVHGGLRPSSVVFDGDGVPYLTDFAMASTADDEPRSIILGTPAYLPPEQWEGAPATEAWDQYSLAVVAYEAVTGTKPHEGQADPDVRARNFRRGPPPAHEEAARSGRPEVPKGVSAVLAKALSVSPEERYASVLDFSAAFGAAVRGLREEHGQPYVFISYQREPSAAWAILFKQALEGHGFDVFVDTLMSDGQPQIPDRIREEILRSDVFVCLLAPGTLGSGWVRQEIEIAATSGKPMVPVLFEDFHAKDEAPPGDPHVKALLDFDGVHLFNRKNVALDYTFASIGERIRKLV